jgi:hypothetical protein
MDALHELDAMATWQGGFDYYFAHQEEPEVWDRVQSELRWIGLADAAELFGTARDLFARTDHASDEQEAMSRYLAEMHELDARWRDCVPALHRKLTSWRSERGLEEFDQTGW